MAHPISVKLDKLSGVIPVECNEKCEYWRFPHLDTACVLSEVYSVCKGELCYIFKEKKGE